MKNYLLLYYIHNGQHTIGHYDTARLVSACWVRLPFVWYFRSWFAGLIMMSCSDIFQPCSKPQKPSMTIQCIIYSFKSYAHRASQLMGNITRIDWLLPNSWKCRNSLYNLVTLVKSMTYFSFLVPSRKSRSLDRRWFRHWSDVFTWDRRLIDVDPRVFVIRLCFCCSLGRVRWL